MNEEVLFSPISRVDKDSDIKIQEEKKYLVLLNGIDEDEKEFQMFEFKEGRLETYMYIKTAIEYIDLETSKVIVETVKFETALNVYDFMTLMQDKFGIDTDFDLTQYKY